MLTSGASRATPSAISSGATKLKARRTEQSPRVSPDGAEEIVTGGRPSRSAPRLRRHAGAAHWVRRDMDGDGTIRQLRCPHPAGEFVSHPDHAHVLVPRTIPLKLTLPAKYLVPGAKYSIKITAKSPTGAKKTLSIPFSG